jgi:hypothetical protein
MSRSLRETCCSMREVVSPKTITLSPVSVVPNQPGVCEVSTAAREEYVEDCPVCCRPNVMHVEMDVDGDARVGAQGE